MNEATAAVGFYLVGKLLFSCLAPHGGVKDQKCHFIQVS